MYELHSGPHNAGSAKCVDPDWEEIYKQKKIELDAIKVLVNALIEFINKVKPSIHSTSPISTFLGTLSIDVLQREAYIETISKNINA